ncbi:hypothetical protein SAMN05192562_10360 [Kosakonia arachidis]|uniref:Uncharacterized protein n=1 Tax=Kosakonia arachidis TaxID=551989 RepID=A0A1I7BZF1_9ENTR|nr:hypothetical protein [Kosakonia arachidis]SFT92551.1 hypothetical protein SAMN05192562_10360 [Kosakonia arachidis]
MVIPTQLGTMRYLSGKVTAISAHSEELDGIDPLNSHGLSGKFPLCRR